MVCISRPRQWAPRREAPIDPEDTFPREMVFVGARMVNSNEGKVRYRKFERRLNPQIRAYDFFLHAHIRVRSNAKVLDNMAYIPVSKLQSALTMETDFCGRFILENLSETLRHSPSVDAICFGALSTPSGISREANH